MFFIDESTHIEVNPKADQRSEQMVRVPEYEGRNNKHQHKRTNKWNESNNT